MKYETKDSGARVEYDSGMRRDVDTDKPRYDLVWKPGLKRLAELMARGAEKYGDSNWMLADSKDELGRFLASANRHFEQWMAGERDEDHMAATVFNLFAAEYVRGRLLVEDETFEPLSDEALAAALKAVDSVKWVEAADRREAKPNSEKPTYPEDFSDRWSGYDYYRGGTWTRFGAPHDEIEFP